MIASLLPVYDRTDIIFDYGKGCYLYDKAGKKYLDFGTGYATLSLGHCHPVAVKALTDQAKKLWHVGNTYRIDSQEKLAAFLVKHTFADSAFFVNSGSEATDMAIKMARRYFYEKGEYDRTEIITFEGAFHGRTYGAISASRGEKMIKGFAPLVDGFDQVPFGDLKALERAITKKTAAIFIEPIQGEGGIRMMPSNALKKIRALCDKHKILLIFDEVQTGNGRTGKFFAHEWGGVKPDIVTTAKGLAAGFPIGAVLAVEKVAKAMKVGSHGSTFGGNPLATTVALNVMAVVFKKSFFTHVQKMGDYLAKQLDAFVKDYPHLLTERRGIGLMQGVRCKLDDKDMRNRLRKQGLLTMLSSENVLRFLPPLIIQKKQIDDAMKIFKTVLDNF